MWASLTGCLGLSALTGQRQPLEETVVYGEKGPKLLLLEIQGEIRERDEPAVLGSGTESTVARVREQLSRAREAGVRGLLLRVDSPGGTASASELIYGELMRFKRDTGVPVVAQLMSTAASGGFYVAMAADEIQAYPTSVVGSIGVIVFGVNVSGLMDKLGIVDQTLTSGPMKDAGSPLRPMAPDERAALQAIVDEMHGRFREVVGAGRPELGAQRVAELADGRVYGARRALELGLIDRIADIETAIDRLEAMAGIEESRVVSYHRPREWRNNLYTRLPSPPTLKLDLSPLFGRTPEPGFYFLWWPAFD